MVRMAIAGPVGTIRIHPAIEAREDELSLISVL
jgi:hypothetical protein